MAGARRVAVVCYGGVLIIAVAFVCGADAYQSDRPRDHRDLPADHPFQGREPAYLSQDEPPRKQGAYSTFRNNRHQPQAEERSRRGSRPRPPPRSLPSTRNGLRPKDDDRDRDHEDERKGQDRQQRHNDLAVFNPREYSYRRKSKPGGGRQSDNHHQEQQYQHEPPARQSAPPLDTYYRSEPPLDGVYLVGKKHAYQVSFREKNQHHSEEDGLTCDYDVTGVHNGETGGEHIDDEGPPAHRFPGSKSPFNRGRPQSHGFSQPPRPRGAHREYQQQQQRGGGNFRGRFPPKKQQHLEPIRHEFEEEVVGPEVEVEEVEDDGYREVESYDHEEFEERGSDSDDERGFAAGIPPDFPSLKGLAKTAFPDKGRNGRRKQQQGGPGHRHENPFQFRRRFSAMF